MDVRLEEPSPDPDFRQYTDMSYRITVLPDLQFLSQQQGGFGWFRPKARAATSASKS